MNEPALYASTNDFEYHVGVDATEEFADELAKISGRCIDIGSGPGDVVAKLILPKLDPRATIVCSDISEHMLNHAKKVHGDNDRLSFIKLDIKTRNIPENLTGQFSHVTSFYCLDWCQDMRQVFENIFNLLLPGGATLLSFVANHPVYDTYQSLALVPQYQPYMKDSSRFIPVYQKVKRPRNALKKLLEEVGFDIHHLSERQMIHVHDTLDNLSDFVVSLNPFTERMPVDLGEEYKKDLVEAFVKHDNVFQRYDTEHDRSMLVTSRVFVVRMKKPQSA